MCIARGSTGPAIWLALALAVSGAAKESSRARELARQLNEAFVEVADIVSPAVVVIDIVQQEPSTDDSEGARPWLDLLPEEFRERLRKDRTQPPENGREFNAQGSGMLISKEGDILTNNHVVEDAQRLRVRLKDGREFEAEVRGTDPQSDLAVIRLKGAPKDLPVVQFGDSDKVRVGEFAIAIGAPFRLDYSVTYGHISAKSRSDIIGGMMDQNFLQTDANINPGNSGGPLVNIEGEVIGINSMIRGLNSGIGFAIPSNLAREIATRLVRDGKFVRCWLGINIGAVRDEEELRELAPQLTAGVVVRRVIHDGPASKAEPAMKPSDVIVAVDGRSVATPSDLKSIISRKAPGTTVVLDVRRINDDKKIEPLKVRVSPEAFPERTPMLAMPSPRTAPEEKGKGWGITVEPLTKNAARGSEVEAGVVVAEVAEDSVAAEDLRAGDIITEINHQPVASPTEFNAAMKRASLKKGVLMNVIRDGQSKFRVLKEREE